jgi:hypothetical protein
MQEQAALGNRQVYSKPSYSLTQVGRVVSVGNYDKTGTIEVVFLDYSKPFPVWVNGDIDRKPTEGDLVLVGFIQERQDAPYLAGFVRNESYTANFIKVEKDRIVIQLPTDTEDIKGHLLDDNKQTTRKSIVVTASGITINGNISVNGNIAVNGTVSASNIP